MILQLRRLMVKGGYFNDHILVSIVKLTVETNLVTSKDLSLRSHNASPLSHARLATVSVIALFLVAVHPVSSPVYDVRPFTEVDVCNVVEELVFVPVRIRLRFYKSLSCMSSDDFWYTIRWIRRTFLLGKLYVSPAFHLLAYILHTWPTPFTF